MFFYVLQKYYLKKSHTFLRHNIIYDFRALMKTTVMPVLFRQLVMLSLPSVKGIPVQA